MSHWEYLAIIYDEVGDTYRVRWVGNSELRDWKRGAELTDYMNGLGKQGWELVAHESRMLTFKRPAASDTP